MYSNYWRVYFKRKSSELNGSIWGCGREFGFFLPFVIHSCVWYGWESGVRATKPSVELWTGWGESDSLNLCRWRCRIFPVAQIKILVDTYQLEWWLIICLWGTASCQQFAGWNKGRESLDWAVFTCFWFLGEKEKQSFNCSSYAVSGCAKAKQVSSSHILVPTASHLTFLHPVPRCCCITTNFSNLCSCQAHILPSQVHPFSSAPSLLNQARMRTGLSGVNRHSDGGFECMTFSWVLPKYSSPSRLLRM